MSNSPAPGKDGYHLDPGTTMLSFGDYDYHNLDIKNQNTQNTSNRSNNVRLYHNVCWLSHRMSNPAPRCPLDPTFLGAGMASSLGGGSCGISLRHDTMTEEMDCWWCDMYFQYSDTSRTLYIIVLECIGTYASVYFNTFQQITSSLHPCLERNQTQHNLAEKHPDAEDSPTLHQCDKPTHRI